jgi:hypothetical protein
MLSEPRCLDLWAKVRPGDVPLGSPGVSTEEIVRFARLVEAAALENAARPTTAPTPATLPPSAWWQWNAGVRSLSHKLDMKLPEPEESDGK